MPQAKSVLVTGGTGFIGSHTAVELLERGYEVSILDNLSNSMVEVLDRIQQITSTRPKFFQADIRDKEVLDSIFEQNTFDAVLHFAGLKAVGESVEKPWEYYDNNITGTLTLVDAMRRHGVKTIVFSSSATVYGDPDTVPITEDTKRNAPTNPYGRTKFMLEDILTDIAAADPEWNVSLLRYFNPIGAHPSGLIGEDPRGIPNNLMPYITKVAAGKLPELGVFGDDYDTHDGSGVRDYIHVVDLALGHISALEYMETHPGVSVFNLGTGVGYSVLDVVHAFIDATGVDIPYSIKPRRAGDIAECYSSADKAYREMGWKAERGIAEMCADSWRWQSGNPDGYRSA